MALSVEKLLTDAHTLIIRLKDHDSVADNIIASTQALLLKVEAMKQYQDDITELNEIAKHRPRSTLVLGIAQENRQIRELQHENRELQATLEDHQSALELIMQKYREHTVKLLQSNRLERALQDNELSDKNSMCHLMDKIDEMAGVMQKAIEVDETTGCADKERLSQLEVENRALRELLEICTTSRDRILPGQLEAAVAKACDEKDKAAGEEEEEEEDEDTANEEDDETDSSECNSTIMSPPPVKKETEEKKGDKAAAVPKKSPDRNGGKEKDKDTKDKDAKDKDAKDKDTKEKDTKEKDTKEKDTKEKDTKEKDTKEKDGKDSQTASSSGPSKTVKSPGQSKSLTDVKKTKSPAVGGAAKKPGSGVAAKKDTTSTTVRKSPSVETKKDLKGKTTATKPAVKK